MPAQRLVVIFRMAGAFAVGVVFSAVILNQPSQLSAESVLAEARNLDEVELFLKRYPNATAVVQMVGAMANVLFVSPDRAQFETCSDEFCSNRFTVRPYLRVISDATQRDSHVVYCGFGEFTGTGQPRVVNEFRPFDQTNSPC